MSRAGQGCITWTLQTVRDRCEEIGDCWIWRGGCTSNRKGAQGYPATTIHGKKGVLIRRYTYEVLLGRVIQPGRMVTARCGNPLCCSPSCLVQKTRAEIMHRMIEGIRARPMGHRELQNRAVKAGRSKVGAAAAEGIRASELPDEDLAREHGVHLRTIQRIKAGQSWASPRIVNSIFNLGG